MDTLGKIVKATHRDPEQVVGCQVLLELEIEPLKMLDDPIQPWKPQIRQAENKRYISRASNSLFAHLLHLVQRPLYRQHGASSAYCARSRSTGR